MVRDGHRAIMVYLIQRSDAKNFSLARDIDPFYFETWSKSTKSGVESIAMACTMGDDAISCDTAIEIEGVS